MKNVWIMAVALVLVLGAAGYTIAQSSGGSQGGMMGPGMEMVGGGMMGQGGQGGMMGSGMTGMMTMMSGQPLSEEQLKQFAEQHGITPDQAKQMTDQCSRIMGTSTAPETPKQ
jgi:hypothetical protein